MQHERVDILFKYRVTWCVSGHILVTYTDKAILQITVRLFSPTVV